MPNLGAPEILMILVVALLVFGPRKLPELGKSLGAGLREFRRSTRGLKEEFDGVMREVDTTQVSAPVQVIAAQPQVRSDVAVPVSVAAVTPQQTAAVSPVPSAEKERQSE